MAGHDEHDSEGHGSGGHKSHGGGHHAGGGHAEGEHEGAPEWLISFADNVMLQMGFFVILLALNLKPASSGGADGNANNAPGGTNPALIDAAIAIREAFNNPVDINSQAPSDQPLIQRIRQREGQGLDRGPKGLDHETQSIRPSDFYAPAGLVRFEPDSADLTMEARLTTDQIADTLRAHRTIIEVRGHASGYETMHDQARGMRLSYDRAWNVARVLAERGIPWNQLRVVACSDGHPVVSGPYAKEDGFTNQRAEVIVTQEPVAAGGFSGTPDTVTPHGQNLGSFEYDPENFGVQDAPADAHGGDGAHDEPSGDAHDAGHDAGH